MKELNIQELGRVGGGFRENRDSIRFTAQYLEYCLFLKRSGDLIYEGYQTVRDGKSCRRINLIETSLRNQSVSPREADPPLGRRRRNVSATADTAGGYVNQTVLEAV